MGVSARVAGLALVALLAGGCAQSKEDMIRKAEGVSSKSELESRLGRPDDISKLGPMETWTYEASNGQVVFLIVGDTVTWPAAGAGERKR
jgi:hypothetical protein